MSTKKISKIERETMAYLDQLKIDYKYQPLKIKFQPKVASYTPDFLLPNGILVETKGGGGNKFFTSKHRTIYTLVKEQNPKIDLRFVFENPRIKINKKSKTTFADWCDQHGFKWAEKRIPLEWIKEKK